MQLINWHVLPRMAGNLKTPAIISSVLVLPFIILELVNRRSLPDDFPVALFGFMWFLALSFVLVLLPLLRKPKTEHPGRGRNLRSFVPRIGLLVFIAWFWVSLVLDQMPCFLGVPNCD